ncbi:GntR family transcriptional regulator [Hansschlegelia quercus]|uniref:GntR family transcriptional regulator n=1 Tax=Hansschlegelia quercus TaxID=2528245 RepID=A0A4V2JE20_9HYPH|nr:GntR family transcriptional regulator [Hansschlegelia quercus]TBN53616.1 GntR family transcriptional regulator [Hansschlegelia quercus]
MKPTSPIIRHSLYQSLVAPLREMIMQGELRPGEKVPEEQLCERFGVSRTPIREALKVLAAEGALEILPHRGAIVSRISEEKIAELFPIMASLERLAGSLACERATDADVARVKNLHEQMMACYRSGDEPGYLRFNRLIHETFFEIAGNATLVAFYQQILTRINACRFVVRKKPEHWRNAVAEHEEMIGLLEARAGAELGELLERHVTGTTVGIARAYIKGETAAPSSDGRMADAGEPAVA